jgi:hypothetical protein
MKFFNQLTFFQFLSELVFSQLKRLPTEMKFPVCRVSHLNEMETDPLLKRVKTTMDTTEEYEII